MNNNIEVKQAQNPEDFSTAKILILEYTAWLGIDLSFQNFDAEIATMPTTFGDPNGALFIVFYNNNPVGVAGIKRFSSHECEVKRMFVQPSSRGLGIGEILLSNCIESAKKLNYSKIKLDTAAFMKSAIKLYANHGFIEIPAYRDNPYEEAKFFELDLNKQP